MPKVSKKQTFNMVLPRPALDLHKFAMEIGGPRGRPELSAVAIEVEMQGKGRSMSRVGHAVATDGVRMGHYWWNIDQDASELPKSRFLLDPEACEEFVAHTQERPKGEPQPVFRAVSDGDIVELEADSEYIPANHDDEHGMSFPEGWRSIIPEDKVCTQKTSLVFKINVHLLHEFSEYLTELGNDRGVKVTYADHTVMGPILVTPLPPHNIGSFDDYPGYVEYVLMPLRT